MSLSFIIVAEPYTAVAGNNIQADTSGGSFTVTLPATANIGDFVGIEDAKLSWNTDNLTIARNGLNINGGTSNYTASVVGNKLSIVYISSTYGWSIK
jgi:Ran-binding protein 9/10